MRLPLFVGLAWLLSCAAARPSLDRTPITGGLELGVPAGWSVHDFSSPDHVALQWTPAPGDDSSESLLVTSVERPVHAKAPRAQLEQWLAEAQRKLPNAAFGHATSFVTRNGFSGVRIEGAFVPLHRDEVYRRLHAVVVDGTSLVHVIYTAKQLDHESFDAIVDSLSREGQ